MKNLQQKNPNQSMKNGRSCTKGSNSKLQEEQRRNRPSKTEASKLNRAKTALTNANQRKPV